MQMQLEQLEKQYADLQQQYVVIIFRYIQIKWA